MGLAVYPGSFDPATNGHVNMIRRAAKIFDHVVVAVAYNIKKIGMFSVDERVEMLRDATAGIENVEVDSFDGLLVDYMRRRKARVVLRGLRALSDFEYEFQMAHVNNKLHPDIETVFLVAGAEEFFISSQVVKEVATLGGMVACLVPERVKEELEKKVGKRKR
jgi:pantetheine-phosphate adenylyltransferase